MNSTKYVLAATFLSIASGVSTLATAATTANALGGVAVAIPVAPAPTPVPVAAPVTAPAAPAATAPVPLNLGITTGISSKPRHHEEDAEHDEKHKHKAKKDKDEKKTFSGSINGDTLTIEKISSDFLKVGSKLSGPGIPKGTRITEFLTGKGGVGTYKIVTSSGD